MNTLTMNPDDEGGFKKALEFVKQWCQENPCKVGAAEIVLGSGLIALGLKSGAIEMGSQLVCVGSERFDHEALLTGSLTGTILSAAGLLGGIGVAAAGGAIGIPAGIVAGVGALAGFGTGYSLGDLASRLLRPSFDWANFLGGGSLLSVGLALILDGCRRILGSEVFKRALSFVKDGIIYLAQVTKTIVCQAIEGLKHVAREMCEGVAKVVETLVEKPVLLAGLAVGAAIVTAVVAPVLLPAIIVVAAITAVAVCISSWARRWCPFF